MQINIYSVLCHWCFRCSDNVY